MKSPREETNLICTLSEMKHMFLCNSSVIACGLSVNDNEITPHSRHRRRSRRLHQVWDNLFVRKQIF